ncbi:MAG TPA: hypothetical protein ENI27_10020, partial [bacterium]|nr:hypothetical protein [bacterium]
VFLPGIVVVLGTIWTLGLMSLLGFRLSVVSVMVPPLVLALGSSYSIHVLNQYYRSARVHTEDKMWIAASVAHINRTISLAALTTIIGFVSLVSGTLPQVREFGLATSFGIFFCGLLSLFLFPAVVPLLKPPTARERDRVLEGHLSRSLQTYSQWVVKGRYVILAFLILVALVFGLLLPRVHYQTDYTAYQKKSESAIDDYLYSTRTFGGFVFLYITLTAPEGESNYFLRPKVLQRIARFEEVLEQDQDISYLSSFSAYIRFMNQTMTGKRTIPERRAPILLLSRYFRSIAVSPGNRQFAEALVNQDFSRLTLTLRVYNSETNKPMDEKRMNALIERLTDRMQRLLDADTQPVLWGDSLAYLSISEILSRDQIKSVLVSLVLILAVTTVAFRSIKLGLFSLIPIFTGIMLTISIMTLVKIPFDVVTVMFTSVAIGVGIDDSIHLIIQYRHQQGNIAQALSMAGRPILLTSASLIAGLLVLLLSSFLPVVYFGLLISLVLVTTTLGALIILPAILSLSS